MTGNNAKPLTGVRVIEVGQLLAGPWAGTMLAYFGAEVIKIEPPKVGDPIRKWRAVKKRYLVMVVEPGEKQKMRHARFERQQGPRNPGRFDQQIRRINRKFQARRHGEMGSRSGRI